MNITGPSLQGLGTLSGAGSTAKSRTSTTAITASPVAVDTNSSSLHGNMKNIFSPAFKGSMNALKSGFTKAATCIKNAREAARNDAITAERSQLPEKLGELELGMSQVMLRSGGREDKIARCRQLFDVFSQQLEKLANKNKEEVDSFINEFVGKFFEPESKDSTSRPLVLDKTEISGICKEFFVNHEKRLFNQS